MSMSQCSVLPYFPEITGLFSAEAHYEEFIDITLPEGIELMNRDGVKAEAGIATALIRIGERKGKARIIVSDGQLKGDMEVEIR